jgi:hypothetical protein
MPAGECSLRPMFSIGSNQVDRSKKGIRCAQVHASLDAQDFTAAVGHVDWSGDARQDVVARCVGGCGQISGCADATVCHCSRIAPHWVSARCGLVLHIYQRNKSRLGAWTGAAGSEQQVKICTGEGTFLS